MNSSEFSRFERISLKHSYFCRSEAEVHDLLTQGACGFLPKPHRFPTVARAIREVLDCGRLVS